MKMWILIAFLMLMAMPISAYAVDFTVGCLGNVSAGSCICRTTTSCIPTTCSAVTCPNRINTTKSSACTQSRTNNCGSFSPPDCDSGTCTCTISGGVCNYNCLSGYANCDSNNDNGCECYGTCSGSTCVPPVSDTCTYSGSGNWFININDNCTLSTVNTITGKMYIYGHDGFLNFQANQYANGYYFNVTNAGKWFYNSYRWFY